MSSEHFIEDDSILVIDFAQILSALKSRWHWIVTGVLIATALAAGFSYWLFHETYQSSAKLLLDTTDSSRLIGAADLSEQPLKGQGLDTSPYRNQEELLRSDLMFNRVFKRLQAEKGHFKFKNANELPEKSLSAEHIKGTNFIRIMAKADQPQVAQKLANLYMQAYLDLMNEISYTPIQQKKKLFEAQVEQAEVDLAAIDLKVKSYQEAYGILDMTIESQNQVRQMVNLNSQSQTIQADLSQKRAEASRIRKQLKLNPQDLDNVLQAVAKGQDSTLIALQEKLQELQKDYDAKALIYAPTNPDMVQLDRRLQVLKNQIADQQIVAVGHVMHSKTGMIRDSVRTDLVNRLASADSESSALQQRLQTLQGQYTLMRRSLQDLPAHQLEYAKLMLDKKSREDVLSRLKENLAEARIQEAAVRKRLMVIDPPNMPLKPMAPLRWHIVLIAAAAALFLGCAAVAGYAMANHRTIRPEFVEQSLEMPVMGSLPWISDDKWHYFRSRSRLEVLATDADPDWVKAYQDLSLNLKVRRNQLQQNAVVMSQVFGEKGTSVLLANLAFCLAQSGERVLLIDANLRQPGLHEAFNHSLDYERGLPELINSVSELMHRKPDTQVEDVLQLASRVITPSGLHPQLEYLNAGLSLMNTFEFLNAKSFHVLINVLKTGYDWVLLNAPPLLVYPDCSVLLGYADGLLLVTDPQTEESHLAAVSRKLGRLNSLAYGVVLRELKP